MELDLIKVAQNFLGKDIETCKILTGGLTNEVYLLTLSGGVQVVMKQGDDLAREIDFFGSIEGHGLSYFPKLLGTLPDDNILFLEFREGIGGKEVVDMIDENNRYLIGSQFAKALKDLHGAKVSDKFDKDEKISQMIDYVNLENTVLYPMDLYQKELGYWKELLDKTNYKFTILHGDFSPHNVLFTKDQDGRYIVSTILDPSARVSLGIGFFDIVYLFNTRWNRNKKALRSGFLSEYKIDIDDPLFLQTDKMMKMYLAEIYHTMGDEKYANKLFTI